MNIYIIKIEGNQTIYHTEFSQEELQTHIQAFKNMKDNEIDLYTYLKERAEEEGLAFEELGPDGFLEV